MQQLLCNRYYAITTHTQLLLINDITPLLRLSRLGYRLRSKFYDHINYKPINIITSIIIIIILSIQYYIIYVCDNNKTHNLYNY